MKSIQNRIIFGFGPKIELLKNNHERFNILEKAFEKGFRIFETAPSYCFGMSERILGQFYDKKKELKIYTKFGIKYLPMPRVF
jgi:aryl-alcohol dehydrogenase-like predicted oxidoreductase